MFAKANEFLTNVRAELQKVTWPTRKDINASTIVVIGLVIAVAIYLWIVDAALASLIRYLLR